MGFFDLLLSITMKDMKVMKNHLSQPHDNGSGEGPIK